jgi:hypothetical protein
MTVNVLLTVLNAVWGLGLTGIGILMGAKPPSTDGEKRAYKIAFVVLGLAVVVTTTVQTAYSDHEAEAARNDAHKMQEQDHQDQLLSQAKLSYMQGTLDAIAKLEGQNLANLHSENAACVSTAQAIMKMAQGGSIVGGAVPAPQAAITTPSSPPHAPISPQEPVISSVPVFGADGQITGKNFGSDTGGVYIHLRIKPSAQHGVYADGGLVGPDRLVGQNAPIITPSLDPKIIQRWTDTAITLHFPDYYWDQQMLWINKLAENRKVEPPKQSDIEVCYQVQPYYGAEARSKLFCPQ